MSEPSLIRSVWPHSRFLSVYKPPPDTPGRMSIRDRRDSFCGKMSACNNLAQYGIPYSLTTLHTELPQSDIFRRDLEWFLGVCRVVKGLRRPRIGADGAWPAG